jgi:hypothetical protein
MTIATGSQILAADVQAIANGRAKISSGTYSGDNTTNRAIPHGLGVTPKLVIIQGSGGGDYLVYRVIGAVVYMLNDGAGAIDVRAVTAMDATNFYVGNAASYSHSANYSTGPRTYEWIAFSQGA